MSRILTSAGFSRVAIDPFDASVTLSLSGLAGAVRFAACTGPAARTLNASSDDDAKARAMDEIARALAPYVEGDRVALPGAAWLVSARA